MIFHNHDKVVRAHHWLAFDSKYGQLVETSSLMLSSSLPFSSLSWLLGLPSHMQLVPVSKSPF